MPRQINTDGEGPLFKNDNAQELFNDSFDESGKIYSLISTMDDVWSVFLAREERQRIGVPPSYRNGGTLRWILPFLKADGLTNEAMIQKSRENLSMIRDAEKIKYLMNDGYVFIISTSYEPYIVAACNSINFSPKNAYCTKVNIDKKEYELSDRDIKKLKSFLEELAQIVKKPVLQNPEGIEYVKDFPDDDRKVVERLNEIFLKEIYGRIEGYRGIEGAHAIIQDVNPVGGTGKTEAIYDSLRRTGNSMSDVMYVGDSITDMDALKNVREGKGLPISFNGGLEPMENAEIGILSHSMAPWAIFGQVFLKQGKDAAIELARNWSSDYLKNESKNFGIDGILVESTLSPELPESTLVKYIENESIRKKFAEEGKAYRKRVRGVSGTIRWLKWAKKD